jgi:general secretion pathway protein J
MPPSRRAIARVRSGRSGFTLLELLVALTLLSLVTLVMLGALRMGSRVWERSGAELDIVEETVIARGFLRQWIGGAYPLVDRTDPARPALAFQGSRERLDFMAPAPEGLVPGGLARFSLSVEGGGDDGRLAVSVEEELAAPGQAYRASSILMENVATVSFAYFGAEQPNRAPEWRDSWADATRLPSLVRISVTFPAGDRRSWIDLDIVPRIAVSADCEYNPLVKSCRGL